MLGIVKHVFLLLIKEVPDTTIPNFGENCFNLSLNKPRSKWLQKNWTTIVPSENPDIPSIGPFSLINS